MSNLLFDQTTHTYTQDGKKLPSVTEIIKDAGLINTKWFKKSGTDRGTAVHEATEFIDRGDLKVEDFQEEPWYGYVQAYDRFLDETGFQAEEIELMLAYIRLGYAGTMDRVGLLGGSLIVLDIKTGAPASYHGVQLAAYDMMLKDHGYETAGRRVLRLRENGRYSLDSSGKIHGVRTDFSDPVWDEIWSALALSSYWKRRLN